MKEIVGFIILGVVGACLMTGIGIAVVEMVREMCKKCRRKKSKRKIQQEAVANQSTELGLEGREEGGRATMERFKEEKEDIELEEKEVRPKKRKLPMID